MKSPLPKHNFNATRPSDGWSLATYIRHKSQDQVGVGQLLVGEQVLDLDPLAPTVSLSKPPQQLQIRRWCHGEVRLALTPTLIGRKKQYPSINVYKGKDTALLTTDKHERTQKRERLRENTLVKRAEFQDDRGEISGYGALPKRSRLTRYAARTLQEASEIAKRDCGKNGACFTGTIACSTALGFYFTASYSAYITSLCRQWFRDILGPNHHVFGVWEPQRRGALHCHIVVMSNNTNGLQLCINKFHAYWRKLFLDLSTCTKIDLFEKNEKQTWINDERFPRTDAQWLRKDPAKYLGKYCGKEAKQAVNAAVFCPSRWITLTRTTVRRAIAERVRLVLGGVDTARFKQLFRNLCELAQPLTDSIYFYPNKVFWNHWTAVFEVDQEEREFYWQALQGCIGLHLETTIMEV